MHVSRTAIWIAAALIFSLAVALAFALGRLSASPSDTLATASPAAEAAPSASAAVSARATPTNEVTSSRQALSLADLTNADWEQLGMGCVCSLSVAGKAKFIAGGDDVAILRPDGEQQSCPIDNDKLQEMFDGESKIACSAAAVRISPYGKVTPGGDGHSSKARMRVSHDGAAITLDGDWTCAC